MADAGAARLRLPHGPRATAKAQPQQESQPPSWPVACADMAEALCTPLRFARHDHEPRSPWCLLVFRTITRDRIIERRQPVLSRNIIFARRVESRLECDDLTASAHRGLASSDAGGPGIAARRRLTAAMQYPGHHARADPAPLPFRMPPPRCASSPRSCALVLHAFATCRAPVSGANAATTRDRLLADCALNSSVASVPRSAVRQGVRPRSSCRVFHWAKARALRQRGYSATGRCPALASAVAVPRR